MSASDKSSGGMPGKPPAGARARPSQRDDPGKDGLNREPVAEHAGAPRAPRPADCRRERYLAAVSPPTEARTFTGQLERDPQIEVLRAIGRAQAGGGYPHMAVIETTPQRAAALAAMPTVAVEPDQRLGWDPAPGRQTHEVPGRCVEPTGTLRRIPVEVEDDGGHPVEGAAVCLTGQGMPAMGFTDSNGQAALTVPAETAAGPELLAAQPARGCWPARVIHPVLRLGKPVTVRCERVITTFPGFPDRPLASWGAHAMGFDMLPPNLRGEGIRIALVGSGAAASHPDLAQRLTDGRDVVGEDDKSWREDLIGTGTHQAVLIAGRDDGSGVIGLAPEAEVHICRIAPGGTCGDLIEALDYCIEQEIDVALISAGITVPSGLLAAKIAQAREHGVACIAAAGDGGREIPFPASLPGVLTVGAIGQLGSFPPGSGIAAEIAGPPTPEGLFAPRFANHGPGLDCCAPGVGIVSGLPPASYGPLSGTAIAAAHVAAAAALVAAQQPQFRPESRQVPVIRDASRVDRLFQLIIGSCRPLPDLGPSWAGAGIPNVAVAAGIVPWGSSATPPEISARPAGSAARSRGPEDPVQAALATLEAAMRSAGLINRVTSTP